MKVTKEHVIVAYTRRYFHHVTLYNTEDLSPAQGYTFEDKVLALDVSSMDKTLFAGLANGSLYFASTSKSEFKKKFEKAHDSAITAVSHNPATDVLALGGDNGIMTVFDLKQEKVIHTFLVSESRVHSATFKSNYTAEGYNFLVTASNEEEMHAFTFGGEGTEVLIYDTNKELTRHQKPVLYAAFDPNGEKIVTGDTENMIVVFHVYYADTF